MWRLLLLLVLAGCAMSDETQERTPKESEEEPRIGKPGSDHEHATFKVYINNKSLNFTKERFMLQSEYVHLENMNGSVIHTHATGVTLADFFTTLDMNLNTSCLGLWNATTYCGAEKLHIMADGRRIKPSRVIDAEERYLISYGNHSEDILASQMGSVPGLADAYLEDHRQVALTGGKRLRKLTYHERV